MKLPTTLSDLHCLTPDQKWLKLWSVRWARGAANGLWTFVSRKAKPQVETGKIEPDAVIIVPTWFESSGPNGVPKLIITKEYRIPLGGYYYGFPAGLIDKGETPQQAAIRELTEETGLRVTGVTLQSPTIFSSGGLTDESSVMIFVNVEGEPSSKHCEPTEDIETLFLSASELLDLYYARGTYKDACISAKLWPVLHAWLVGK